MNIQAQAWPAGPHSDAEWRAQNVVKALQPENFAEDEVPDIVVFNEADNEDAKEILEAGLKDLYPFYFISFNGGSGDLNDGGLAVFSRFEFVTLPASDNNSDDNKSRFYPYNTIFNANGLIPMSAGADGLAEKGVAIVQVSTGLHFEVVTIALTHLQAFYDEPGQHHEIRLRQLKVIEAGLINLLGEPEFNNAWDKVIVLGDLNIRGDRPPMSTEGYGEWMNVFLNNGGPYNNPGYGITLRPNRLIFTENLVDGWRTHMAPPGAIQEADPGLTNVNLKAGDNLPALFQERLDYICFPKNAVNIIGDFPRRLVPQYMRILPSNFSALDMAFERIQSDHKAILAQVHWEFRYNTPAKARVQQSFFHFEFAGSPAKVRVANDFQIYEAGVFQWIYMSEPGTYTFFHSVGVDVSFYFQDNLSTRIDPYDKVRIKDLGLEEARTDNLWQEFHFADEGQQVDVYKPMFIKMKAALSDPGVTELFSFGFIKHTGENRQLAISLRANDAPKNPQLPVGKENGVKDECWFRAPLRESLLSGNPYPVQFYVQNDFEKKIKVSLYKSVEAKTAFARKTTTDSLCLLEEERIASMNDVYMLLKRADVNDYQFLAGYRYTITYITHLEIYCIDDQSGLGADEIRLSMTVDDMTDNFLEYVDDDFSDDERRMLNGFYRYPTPVAFERQINITVYEIDDGHDDDGPFHATIPALVKGENERSSSVIIEAEGALYQVIYKLSRHPNI